jgi:hypothetical protein
VILAPPRQKEPEKSTQHGDHHDMITRCDGRAYSGGERDRHAVDAGPVSPLSPQTPEQHAFVRACSPGR